MVWPPVPSELKSPGGHLTGARQTRGYDSYKNIAHKQMYWHRSVKTGTANNIGQRFPVRFQSNTTQPSPYF